LTIANAFNARSHLPAALGDSKPYPTFCSTLDAGTGRNAERPYLRGDDMVERIDALSMHMKFAGGGLQTCDDAKESGLSGAAFPEDCVEFAFSVIQRNIFENDIFAEMFCDATNR
jgi:hypothetical protein